MMRLCYALRKRNAEVQTSLWHLLLRHYTQNDEYDILIQRPYTVTAGSSTRVGFYSPGGTQ